MNSSRPKLACPSCGLDPDPDNTGVKAWSCNYCPAVICQWCYIVHTGDKHPEAYTLKTPGEKQ